MVIAGIVVPSNAPVFLAVLALHVPAGLVAAVAGIVAMLSRKAPGRHPSAGTIYYWSLSVVFVSMAALSAMRWSEDDDLFVLGLLSFAAATMGRMARRKAWPSWARWHILGMGASYILLLTAFYVDNGKNLPLWRELPQAAFWILPTALGAPILLRALLRHPLARDSRKMRI